MLVEVETMYFSGINVGTVVIQLVTDTSVVVGLLIKKDVQKFIKSDAVAVLDQTWREIKFLPYLQVLIRRLL
jgi:hypothetical protein